MELNKSEIAERLKIWAKEQGFGKIRELAEALQIPEATLKSAYLNGKSLPGAPVLARLIQLGCDLKWLFFGENKYTPPLQKPPVVNDKNKVYRAFPNDLEELPTDIQNYIEFLEKSNNALAEQVEVYKEYLTALKTGTLSTDSSTE